MFSRFLPHFIFRSAAFLGTAVCALAASTQGTDAPPEIPPAASSSSAEVGSDAPATAATNLREVSPGIYQVGQLTIDQKAATIRFPGRLNMSSGVLEYLLSSPQGSTHESLLVTEIPATDIHFAMLLLGAKGSKLETEKKGDSPPPQIDARFLKTAPKLTGDRISISLEWILGQEKKTAAVEDWLFRTDTKKAAERGPWTYNGSMFHDTQFLAQTEGNLAALVTNPSALINNPRPGDDDDQIWTVNEKAVPPVKTPVEIRIKLLPEKPAAETSHAPIKP